MWPVEFSTLWYAIANRAIGAGLEDLLPDIVPSAIPWRKALLATRVFADRARARAVTVASAE
eukprot:15260195-Alexandrium_andersonii.AAC.1